jgi:PIN domain nuclease of toxin-antitoxin system
VRLILDTHVLIWILEDIDRLGVDLVDLVGAPTTEVRVSAVSVWEIAIKRALGKLDAPHDLVEQLTAHRFDTLDITVEHAFAVEQLPPHHGDPFDRMLVAQATVEDLTIVTRDRSIARYDVDVLPA